MRRMTLTGVALVIAILCTTSPCAAQVDDDAVVAAIRRGVEYLQSLQRPNGLFTETGEKPWFPAGRPIRGADDCWVMVGFAFAGLKPTDEVVRKGFDAMLKLELDQTYGVAPRVIAISRFYHQLDRERRQRAKVVLKRDLKWLVEAQGADGQYGYDSLNGGGRITGGWDFSNVQMAVLALGEAVLAGFEPPNDVFLKAQKLYLDRQLPDGGWNYGSRGGFQAADNPNGSYGSMTAAAVASLFITRDYLYRGLGCPCSGGRSKLRPNKVDQAINRGLKWLGREFVVDTNPKGNPKRWTLYWLYSCERVGLAAGYKYFGKHNWYAEGARHLIGRQQRNGSWQLGGEVPSDTVYAICFLAKGRAPILFNKLKFDGQWNNHPRDMANLVRRIGKLKEQPVQWQIISLEAPVDEWHDAPVLYITAEMPLELTDEQKGKLRRFTDTGGTILFEASCGNRRVLRAWKTTCKEIWPEWELRTLSKEHAIYAADQPIRRPLPRMLEMNDGLRTILFVAQTDISCPWHTMAVTRRKVLFDFGANLHAYATDRRPLRARLAKGRSKTERYAGRVTAGSRKNLTVARVTHGGDHYVGQNYGGLKMLAESLEKSAGLTLSVIDPKTAGDLKPEEVHVAWLAGRKGVTMGDADAKALKAYLASGGFLVAEAVLGDRRFDKEFRALATQIGVKLTLLPLDKGLLAGETAGATGYTVKTVRFKPALLAERVGRQVPELYRITLGGKMVGVYSPLDLVYAHTGYDAWGSRGYGEADARAILTNVFLYCSSR